MIVNWKKEKAGVIVIPCMSEDNLVVDHITLLQGNNDIPDKLWEMAKNSVAHHIENGNIEEVVEKKEGKSGSKGDKLKDLNAKKAKKVVLDTWNMETLNAWLEVESRDEIRATIHNQIEAVNNPKRG
jgi:hypothetical protein